MRAQDSAAALPDADERRAAAVPVREVARSRDDSLFSDITSIATDSRGRIYVGDWMAARVVVLDSGAALVRTLGRKGLGPGEFRSVRGLQVLNGDSLLVYDPNAGRLSVFAPDAAPPAYVVNLGGSPFLVERVPGSDAFVSLTRPPFTPDATSERRDEVRVLDAAGRPQGEPLRTYPSKSFIRVQQGRGYSVMPNPFGREGFAVAGGEGRVHLAWGDSLAVESTDLQGRRVGGFAVAFQPNPVVAEDVQAAAGDLPPQMANSFRGALRDSVPPRWPAIRALLADADGRIWIALGGPMGGMSEWARFTPEGRYLGSVFLPADVEVKAVRGKRMYAVARDEMDVPRVVVYEFDAQSPAGTAE
ncbi:MAG TPA: 6-bladed beta-propeller [Longimicrobium sp.]|nr:6-bladed beta-propeller [Longimicrobium sp.]